jgi:hypothetical protein
MGSCVIGGEQARIEIAEYLALYKVWLSLDQKQVAMGGERL